MNYYGRLAYLQTLILFAKALSASLLADCGLIFLLIIYEMYAILRGRLKS